MDPIQTMPNMEFMVKANLTPRECLQYYKNVWTRNVVARTIDVACDQALKTKDPEELVANDDGRQIPVKERLEHRKIIVQDALDLIAAIDVLLAIPEAEFTAKVWSKEALKVDADMLPPEPVVGAVCQLDNGAGEGVYAEMEGKIVCVAKEAPAPEVTAEAAPEAVTPTVEAPAPEAATS